MITLLLVGAVPAKQKYTRKKHNKNRWHKTGTYLPKQIADILKVLFDEENPEYYRAVKLMARILKKYSVEDKAYYESVCLPNNYIRKTVTSPGMKIWKILLDNEILVRTKKWSTYHHKASEYKINPIIKLVNPVKVTYKEVNKRSTPLSKKIKAQLNRISLDINVTLDEFMDQRLPLIEKSIRKKITGNIYLNSKRKKKKIIGSVEEFIAKKVISNKIKQYNQLLAIQNRRWRADRNKTNFRLDTNLTNLHGHFIKLIRIDKNEALKGDLKNSQFVIFSNLLQSVVNNKIDKNLLSIGLVESFYSFINSNYKGCKMSSMSKKLDFIEFCEYCTSGKIYEVLAEILDLKKENGKIDRDAGKKMAFKLFFDQPRKSKRYNLIRNRFPTVVKIIDDFKEHMISIEFKKYYEDIDNYQITNKKEHELKKYKKWTKFVRSKGSSKFSVMLQQVESKIFIDFIYIPLMDDHIVYSIHDSFLFIDPELRSTIKAKLDKYLPYGYVLA